MSAPSILWPGLITVLSLILYFVVSINVGRARVRFKVAAPQTTGNPDFERVYRVQQNTLEQLVSFLPALWLFSLLVNPVWGAGLGAIWIVGRIIYAVGYYQAAQKRGAGFAIGVLASISLLLGSLVSIVRSLMVGV